MAGVGTYYLVGTFREAKRTADAAVTSANEAVRAALAAERANEIAASAAKDAAIAAAEANKINRDAMIASQRAWLSIEAIEAVGPLVWNDDVGKVMIRIAVKNIGKYPAFSVGFAIVAKYDFQTFMNPRDKIDRASRDAESKSTFIGSPVIFLEETDTWTEGVVIPIDKNDPMYTFWQNEGRDNDILIAITAFANYAIEIDSSQHYTATIRHISSSVKSPQTWFDIGGQPVPQERLFFHSSAAGGTFAT